jgi:hypothetical protein
MKYDLLLEWKIKEHIRNLGSETISLYLLLQKEKVLVFSARLGFSCLEPFLPGMSVKCKQTCEHTHVADAIQTCTDFTCNIFVRSYMFYRHDLQVAHRECVIPKSAS